MKRKSFFLSSAMVLAFIVASCGSENNTMNGETPAPENKSFDVNYYAATDGTVTAFIRDGNGNTALVIGYTDKTQAPTTVVQSAALSGAQSENEAAIQFEVTAGDYWRVEIQADGAAQLPPDDDQHRGVVWQASGGYDPDRQ